MTDICKITVVPVVAAGMFLAACGTKKVVVAPPPAPMPAQTASASNRTTTPAYTPPAPRPAADTTASNTSRYPDKATRDRIDTLLARISDAYFDYDQHTLRPDAVKTLQSDSAELRDILKQYPDYKLVIEGHADERGSDEYNLGLGDARAKSAKDYLVQVGIPSGQLSVVSYGKDRPICTDHNESCWQKNRRIHIVAAANQPG